MRIDIEKMESCEKYICSLNGAKASAICGMRAANAYVRKDAECSISVRMKHRHVFFLDVIIIIFQEAKQQLNSFAGPMHEM